MKTFAFICLCFLAQSLQAQDFSVQDSSLYDAFFLKKMAENAEFMGSLKLVNDMIILEEIDTMRLPEYPRMGEVYYFEATVDGAELKVRIERKNYTDVAYEFELIGGDELIMDEGTAVLSTGFIMGSESDESSFSGMSYFVDEFIDFSGDCSITLRLGHEEESGPELLCKIIKDCNHPLPDLTLDNLPSMKARVEKK